MGVYITRLLHPHVHQSLHEFNDHYMIMVHMTTALKSGLKGMCVNSELVYNNIQKHSLCKPSTGSQYILMIEI